MVLPRIKWPLIRQWDKTLFELDDRKFEEASSESDLAARPFCAAPDGHGQRLALAVTTLCLALSPFPSLWLVP